MLNDKIVNNWLADKAAIRPLSRAIISKQATLSYHELLKRSLDTAGYLKSKGITRGDNVGIIFSHNFEFFTILNALWFLGAVPVPLNTRNTTDELLEQIKLAGIKHLVIDEHYNKSFKSINFPDVFYYSQPLVDIYSMSGSIPVEIYRHKYSNTALIMFTSGSSGKPKAVVHTFSSLHASVMLTDSFVHFTHDDILSASLPFYHIGGFMILIRGLVSGAPVAFPESLKFDDLCSSLTEQNPTIISIVPTTLLRFNENNILPNKNLRIAFIGGGPASDDIILKAAENGWPAAKVYGSTETCSMVTVLPTEEIVKRTDCAGKPLMEVKLRIRCGGQVKNDKLRIHHDGQVKNEELRIKSPSLFKEYFNDSKLTHIKIKGGYYSTGDFGWIDDDGYLYIESRREDIVISGGENISIKEIEEIILENEYVEDTCVIPLEDKTWGQIVCAVVQFKDGSGAGEQELKEFLSAKMSPYKLPKKISILDKIPRNEMGKIKRKELLDLILSKQHNT